LIEDPTSGLTGYCTKALGASEKEYRKAREIFGDDFQTGRISEEQFWANMTNQLRVPMPKQKSLWGEAFASIYKPRPDMFRIAGTLKNRGYKIALLSNTERPAVEFFKSQRYDLFDAAIFSCLEGTKKPEREIYEIAIKRIGTTGGQTLFVDDREDFVAGAKEAGLVTILFESVAAFKKDLVRHCPGIIAGME